jgi:hypothetical protein
LLTKRQPREHRTHTPSNRIRPLAYDIGGRFDHVLVDEYQDTNRLQSSILLALKPGGRGLTVVGDETPDNGALKNPNVHRKRTFDVRGRFDDARKLELIPNGREYKRHVGAMIDGRHSSALRMPRTRREQHVMDPAAKASKLSAALVRVSEPVGIEFRSDLSGVRGQHQNARSDDDRLLDRVGDEEDGRTRSVPEFEQVAIASETAQSARTRRIYSTWNRNMRPSQRCATRRNAQ